jgi:hypothetical protein
MKKLLIVMISWMLAGAASAQHFYHGYGGYYRPHRVIVTGGFYPYLGFGFGPVYPYPYAYPYYPYGYGYSRPSKLDLQVEDIKKDYADKISSAKHDSSLSKDERKKVIHDLKIERDNAIDDLKRNYYKHGS